MKKLLFIVLLIVIGMSTTNAQIKVVDDDYVATMTGLKEYYDRDVDFDRIFPRWEQDGCLYPDLSSYYKSYGYFMPNMLGDTIYLSETLSEKPQPNKITVNEGFIYIFNGNTKISNAPTGYYTIDGYMFCTDNADSITSTMNLNLSFFDYNKRTTQSLKKEILRRGDGFSISDLREYQICCVLKSTTDSIRILLHNNYFDNINACMLSFYNEAKQIIGKEIVVTSGYHKDSDVRSFYTAPFTYKGSFFNYNTYDKLNLINDALTQNLVRLEDSKYEIADIVLKDGVFYVVLKGIKTGTFSMKINRLLYAYSADDIDERYAYANQQGNKNGDVVCIKVTSSGNGSFNGNLFVIQSDQLEVLEIRSKIAQAQKEQEIKNRELQRDRERKKQETDFMNSMIAKYGLEIGQLIGNKRVAIGMTKEMCKNAWGHPMNTYRTTTKHGQSEVWCYSYKTRIYFLDGKVVQIDD